MRSKYNGLKNNKNTKTFNYKILVLCLIFIFLGFGANLFSNYRYKSITNEFYTAFNSCDFDKAKTILNTKSFPLKNDLMKKDLANYFVGVIDKICTAANNGEISDAQALVVLEEIEQYNILNSSLSKLITSFGGTAYVKEQPEDIPNINSKNESFNLGITAFKSKDYETAISHFNEISSSEDEYTSAQDYISKCQESYKNELILDSDELIANKYYTKAIELLNGYNRNILSENDEDISAKIGFIEMVRDEYLENIASEDSEYTSNAILQSINISNVNTLNIESKTPYFIYLNLAEQNTYVYEGSMNDWTLIKTFESSTGLPGKETPKGVFSVTGRGDWFFSEEFMQGGKYWVQFMGDYLFHSLPFNRDQSEIVDYTLGVPASHGCVRLNVEDAKWLYDNVGDDTKVIIN